MNGSADAVRVVLRALGEARDGPFYRLWTAVGRAWSPAVPTIGFRVYQTANSEDAYVAVGVTGTRPDGNEFSWSVSVEASPASLTVAGRVEGDAVGGADALFVVVQSTDAADEAGRLIAEFAERVCDQRQPLGYGPRSVGPNQGMRYVMDLTALLRNDPSEFWSHLRALLDERGIDPARAALAESLEQGDDSEFAVVITADGDVYELSWSPTGQGVTNWVCTNERWRDTPYREGIEQAISLLEPPG